MWNVFDSLLSVCSGIGQITKLNMSKTYGSVDVIIKGEKYLLTIMKEEKKDD